MAKYHKYVFDEKNRKLVGKFEIIEWISSRKEKFVIIFGRNKK